MKSLLTLTLISGLMGIQSAKASVDCMNKAHSEAYEKYSVQTGATMFSTSLKFKPVVKETSTSFFIKILDPEAETPTIIEITLDNQSCEPVK